MSAAIARLCVYVLILSAAVGTFAPASAAAPPASSVSPDVPAAAAARAPAAVAAVRDQLRAAAARGAASVVRRQAKDNETCVPNQILCGQVVQSNLTTSDCSTPEGFADLWYFPNYSRQAVGVSLISPDFDVLLGLLDPSQDVLAFDAEPAGQFADAVAYLDTFGNFQILAAAQQSSAVKTGPYQLILECGAGAACQPDAATMCLVQKRFRVQVSWHNQFNNTYGFGLAEPRTDSAGFYSFGDPGNIELLIKVLDYGGGTFKVFYGELTDLQFSIAVTDMQDPLAYTKTYTNTTGDCGGIDQDFLNGETDGALAGAKTATGACQPGPGTNCLLNRRFALTMTWHNQYNDTSGAGSAVPISDQTGAFYFTDKSDLELVAKLIDFGDRIAVYYGALSDLEYDLTVTDTATGLQKTYHNAPGNYCGGLDNSAFP